MYIFICYQNWKINNIPDGSIHKKHGYLFTVYRSFEQPSSIGKPFMVNPYLIFFPNLPLLRTFIGKYCANEMQDKHTKKLPRESYFFKLALHVFDKQPFYKQYRLVVDSKQNNLKRS